MRSQTTIRSLNTRDIPAAVELSSSAGWNQTAEDWRMLIELDPEGCLALECDGHLATTTTLVSYGHRLASLGMVLTGLEYRRRGFAHVLVGRALELADARNIETVNLDATDQGEKLYESLGFMPEQHVERWSGRGLASSLDGVEAQVSLQEICSADREVWPADRSRLLTRLSARGKLLALNGGFLFQRAGRRASYAGPCVAASRETAERLLSSCFCGCEESWLWDLFPANAEAVALAKQFGFILERRLLRMYRGREFRAREEMIYAIAGLEFG